MFGLILSIAAVIALGIFIAYAVIVTIKWLANKIKEKIRKKKAEKVAVGALQEMVNSCTNTASLDELDSIVDEGYDYVIADVDKNGNISDVELVKDKSQFGDAQVDQLINKTGEGIVVIS